MIHISCSKDFTWLWLSRFFGRMRSRLLHPLSIVTRFGCFSWWKTWKATHFSRNTKNKNFYFFQGEKKEGPLDRFQIFNPSTEASFSNYVPKTAKKNIFYKVKMILNFWGDFNILVLRTLKSKEEELQKL